MKSYVIHSSDRKRVLKFAKEQTEAMQQTYIKLILKLTAFELYKLYGFGKNRFSKVLHTLTKEEAEQALRSQQ